MHCSYRVTEVHKNAPIITCDCDLQQLHNLWLRPVFLFYNVAMLYMVRIEKKRKQRKKITFFDTVSQKEIYNKKLFFICFSCQRL